jgi:hypothetical protein
VLGVRRTAFGETEMKKFQIEYINPKSYFRNVVTPVLLVFYYYSGNLIRHSGRSEAESRNPEKATVLLDPRLRGNDWMVIIRCTFLLPG